MVKTWCDPHAGPDPVTIAIATVETAKTCIETTEGGDAPNVLTMMTDPSSWRLDSPRPATIKTHGQMIDEIAETIDKAVEMIAKTVEMIDMTIEIAASAAMATQVVF